MFGLAVMRKNGPKQRVWCRLGQGYVFFFLSCFTHFFGLFRLYSHYKETGKVGLAGDDNNGSKQCVLHRLDQRYVFFYFISCFTYSY